jgi:hypothetical protein
VKAGVLLLHCALLALSTPACWGEDNPQIGNGESFRVQNAQFVRGRFVGAAIQDGGKLPTPIVTGPPVTTPPKAQQALFYQGQSGASFTGEASTNTVAIGLWLQGVGHGYWVVPVGGIETVTGLLTWSAQVDLGRDIPAGLRNLRAVAIDKRGFPGRQAASRICIKSQIPDNFHSCSSTRPVPEAVISLSWDVNADLDLQVIDPDRFVYEAKHPSTAAIDGGMAIPLPAHFDHDSNAGCSIDGGRFENLIWQDDRPQGRYGIYVNLFDACKQAAVHFDVAIYTAEGGEDGGEARQVKRFARSGEVLDISANGGVQRGLFITEFNF